MNLGVWDWKTKHLAREVLQKSTFTQIEFLMIPGSIFHDFWIFGGLGTNFHDFCGLQTGLKFDDFSGGSWGHPRSRDLSGGR